MTFNRSNNTGKSLHYIARRIEGQRLAYYRSEADAAFWDAQWKTYFSAKTYEKAESGHLWQFEDLFTTYLPKNGRILEAGCGLGQYVLALKVRGYDVEGVEWAPQTVQTVRSLYPDLPIRAADVTKLDVPDGFYKGYISLGVAEHRREGPEPFIREASRVLDSDGLALISVPFFHPIRQLKAQMGVYRFNINGLQFYQYAFTRAEFSGLLENAGFRIIHYMTYDYFKGIGDEIPLLRRIFGLRGVGWRLKLWISSLDFAKNLGHMILFVCRKKQETGLLGTPV